VPARGHRRGGPDFGGPSPETLPLCNVTPGVVPRGGWEVRPSARDAAEPTPSTDSPDEGQKPPCQAYVPAGGSLSSSSSGGSTPFTRWLPWSAGGPHHWAPPGLLGARRSGRKPRGRMRREPQPCAGRAAPAGGERAGEPARKDRSVHTTSVRMAARAHPSARCRRSVRAPRPADTVDSAAAFDEAGGRCGADAVARGQVVGQLSTT